MKFRKRDAGIVTAIARHQQAELSMILYDVHATGAIVINHKTGGVEVVVLSCTDMNIHMIRYGLRNWVGWTGGGAWADEFFTSCTMA
jgi:hypothetical protein